MTLLESTLAVNEAFKTTAFKIHTVLSVQVLRDMSSPPVSMLEHNENTSTTKTP